MIAMLELGCGDNPRIPKDCVDYTGIDFSESALRISKEKLQQLKLPFTLLKVNLGFDTIPCGNNQFDFILGDQFLEHVPRIGYRVHSEQVGLMLFNPLIECLNEVYRVAKPGAKLQFNVPKWNSQEQWQDPTHQSAIPANFWKYFDPKDEWNLKESYGIRASFILRETLDGGWYNIFKLETVK